MHVNREEELNCQHARGSTAHKNTELVRGGFFFINELVGMKVGRKIHVLTDTVFRFIYYFRPFLFLEKI